MEKGCQGVRSEKRLGTTPLDGSYLFNSSSCAQKRPTCSCPCGLYTTAFFVIHFSLFRIFLAKISSGSFYFRSGKFSSRETPCR